MLGRARQLRREMTDAERALWRTLRLRQLEGYKFRRQHQIGYYIVDFVCLERRLIVEVDGGQHLDNQYDKRRDGWLKAVGFRVIRFWDHDVLKETDAVGTVILEALKEGREGTPS